LGFCHTYAVLNLDAVALVHIVTWWSGSGEIEAYLSGQRGSFDALTLLDATSGIWPVMIVSEVTYNVLSGR